MCQYYLMCIKLLYGIYNNFEKSLFNDKQLLSISGRVHISPDKESNINEVF